MTTLQNGDRKISVRFSTTTSETRTITTKETTTYVVTLPTIICNNEEDANKIQMTVDEFVSNLVKDIILKDKE